MKQAPTPAERSFKTILDTHFPKIRYKFQNTISIPKRHIIDHSNTFYIIDFVIPQHRLFVEIDGGYHNPLEQQGSDIIREGTILMAHKYRGYKFLRFKNDDVTNNEEDVIKRLRMAFSSKEIQKS